MESAADGAAGAAQGTQADDPPDPERPRIGLALGSGSARGWAHIGVIRALVDMGIEPDIVCGSSIGALVGAAYASGRLHDLEKWVCSLTWKDIIGYLDISAGGGGLIQGERLRDYAHRYVRDVEIQSLPRRLGVVATELTTGREIWLREGSLWEAVRASIALPGLFTPVQLQGLWLLDGGLVNPVPVSLCRAMGADIVIAVNLNGNIAGRHSRARTGGSSGPQSTDSLWVRLSTRLRNGIQEGTGVLLPQLLGGNREAPGLFEVIAGSLNIMQDRITRSRMAGDPPEIMLSPRLSHLGLMEFDKAAVAIREGRASVLRVKPALEEVLEAV